MIFSAKVMLLGDIGVGKSSLAKRLKFDKFDSDYKTTIGVDILTHELELAGGEPVTARLLLWDTDGDFGLHIFKSVYIAGASGALVISDASRPATIQSMFDLAAAFLERLPGRSVARGGQQDRYRDARPVRLRPSRPAAGPGSVFQRQDRRGREECVQGDRRRYSPAAVGSISSSSGRSDR